MRKPRQGGGPEVCSAPAQPTSPAAKGPHPCLAHPPPWDGCRPSLADLGNWLEGGVQGSGESLVSRLGSLSHSQSSQRCPNSTPVAPKMHPAPLWGLWAAPSPLPWVSLSSLPLRPFSPFCRVWSQDPGTRLRPGTSTMALSRPLALSKPPWSQLGWLAI